MLVSAPFYRRNLDFFVKIIFSNWTEPVGGTVFEEVHQAAELSIGV